MTHHLRALFVAVCCVAPVLGAQEPYRRQAGDTLRYREITVDTSVMRVPGGDLPMFLHTQSALRIAWLGGDSARAWYDNLHASVTTAQGVLAPSIDSRSWTPFRLRVTGHGRVSVDDVPTVEAEVAQVFDPRFQFEDFLVTIPAGALPVGRTWVDTVGTETTAQVGTWSRMEAIRRFRVTGDTVAAECQCTLIETESDLTLEIRGPGPTLDRSTRTFYTGTENGVVLWDPAGGRLVARLRSAQLSGTVEMRGGGVDLTTEVRRRYHSVILIDLEVTGTPPGGR